MANVTIPNLTSATTIVPSTDLMVLEQTEGTRKATLSQIFTSSATSGSGLGITSGGVYTIKTGLDSNISDINTLLGSTSIASIGDGTVTGAISQLNKDIISANSYATCSTARSTAAKVVALTGFVLKTGATIKVRFTDTGTSNPSSGNLTLNVNGTGAKGIVDGHTNNTTMTYANAGYFYNNMVCEFVYNGTSWVWLNRDTNTTYTGATLTTSVAKTGSGSTVTNTIATSTSLNNAVGTLLNNDYALNSAKQPKTMSTTIAGQTTVEGCLSQLNTNLSDKANASTTPRFTELDRTQFVDISSVAQLQVLRGTDSNIYLGVKIDGTLYLVFALNKYIYFPN